MFYILHGANFKNIHTNVKKKRHKRNTANYSDRSCLQVLDFYWVVKTCSPVWALVRSQRPS